MKENVAFMLFYLNAKFYSISKLNICQATSFWSFSFTIHDNYHFIFLILSMTEFVYLILIVY